MDKSKITFRQKQIILILIENLKKPKTIKDISNELNVSSRTIMRELTFIEEFLKENDILFVKKSGVGIFIDDSNEKINLLKESLFNYYPINKFSKNDRVLYILESILSSETKSSFFLNKFKISYSTFVKDLDYIKKILDKFNLKMVKKKGRGIYIEGNEHKIRELSSYLFYEKFSSLNLFLMFKNESSSFKDYDDYILNEDTLKTLNQIVDNVFSLFNIEISHKAYVSLIIHLSITIHRIKSGFYCEFDCDVLNKFKDYVEFNISKIILDKISSEFNIEVNNSDICYIAMHLKAHNVYKESAPYSEDFNFDRLDKIKIAGDIISGVEKILGISLMDSSSLIKNLSIHLGPAISRLIMKMNIRNAFLNMMKTEYKEIFDATKKSCKVLEDIILSEVPESEVAYITMHIVSAYEGKLQSKFKYRVLIYAQGESGVSYFLRNKVLKEFPNIIVIGSVSSFNELMDLSYENKNVDFIISTSDIDFDIDYIKVDPSFTISDILNIGNKIKDLFKVKSSLLRSCEFEEKYLDIDKINYLGDTVKLIEDKFKVASLNSSLPLYNIIKDCVFEILDENKEEVFYEVLRKEMLSSSYVKELGVILLHTISKFTEEIFIGSFIPEDEVDIYNGKLSLIFYFIIPESLNTKTLRKVIGELTANLVKDNTFIDVLKSNNITLIRSYIVKILSSYYVNELKAIIRSFENGIEKES